jgi:hypothetical protein
MKGGNHTAVATHSTVKPMAKNLPLLEMFVKVMFGKHLKYVKVF